MGRKKRKRLGKHYFQRGALDLNVIDFIAPSIPELLEQIDGATITLQNTELAFHPSDAKLIDKSIDREYELFDHGDRRVALP